MNDQMIMLAKKQSLGSRRSRLLTRGSVLLIATGLTACTGNPFVGRWDCGQTQVEAQDFRGVVTNEFHYFDDQTFAYEITYDYDFPQARSFKVKTQSVGTYIFADTTFTENIESTTVVNHESDVEISEDTLATLNAAHESEEQIWDYSFEFPSADVLKLEAIDDDEAFTCRRIP